MRKEKNTNFYLLAQILIWRTRFIIKYDAISRKICDWCFIEFHREISVEKIEWLLNNL